MRKEDINYFLVGAFVLGTIALLLALLFVIGGRSGKMDSYQVEYANITGISTSSAVTYQGYPLGEVGAIEPVQREGKTYYRVELRIRKGWRIPNDSVARIISTGLLAEASIDIREGKSAQALAPGDLLQGEAGYDLFAALGKLAAQFDTLSEQGMRPLLDNVNRRVTSLGDTLQQALPDVIKQIERTLARAEESADSLNLALSGDNRVRIDRALTHADASFTTLVRVTANMERTQRQVEALLARSNRIVNDNETDVRAMVTQLRETLEQLTPNIETAVSDMESASRNMNELSRALRRNPGLLFSASPPRDAGSEPVSSAPFELHQEH